LAVIDTRAARILSTALIFALGLGFFYVARHTLMAFLFAILFAYLVDPAVSRVQKFTKGRGSAIAVIYVLLVAVLIAFFFFVGPRIARQAQRLGQSLPALLEQVGSGNIAVTIGQEHGWSGSTIQQAQDFLRAHREDLIGVAQRIGLRAADLAKQSWLLIVVPILAAFFLKDGRAFSEVALSLVQTKPQREFFDGVRGDLNQMLAHFIRAQLTLALLSLVVYLIFLGLMRVPYTLVLATAGGFMYW